MDLAWKGPSLEIIFQKIIEAAQDSMKVIFCDLMDAFDPKLLFG